MIWNRDAETASRPTMRALQTERLRATVARARARVPFYRDALAAAGVEDEAVTLDRLAELPFTVKDDLRRHYPFGLFAVPRTEVSRIHASSGTRGKPTVVGYTRHDLGVWREVMARALAAAGAEPGQLVQIAYGYGLFTGGLGFHDGAEHMGLTVVPVSSGNTLRQMLLLQDFRPRGLACTPSFALYIGESLREQGSDPRAIGLAYGLFGAEPWTEAMRAQLEALWGCPAVDFYGLSEIIGPGVAGECVEARDGLHVNEDHFLPEIVDPETGEPLAPGQEGELVLTPLTKEALPLIRYRTGDISSLEVTPCVCGRTTVRMSRIKGRYDDMLIIRGVNLYPSEVERILLGVGDVAPHYQLVVERPGALDELSVLCEPAREGVDRGMLQARLQHALREETGISIAVQVLERDAVPRSEGKAVRVVDRRPR